MRCLVSLGSCALAFPLVIDVVAAVDLRLLSTFWAAPMLSTFWAALDLSFSVISLFLLVDALHAPDRPSQYALQYFAAQYIPHFKSRSIHSSS